MNIKALVVDDSRSMRRIVMKGLQKAQVAEWDFDEAEDGEDALARLTKFTICSSLVKTCRR